jgi:hypothetical protein
LSGFSIYKGLTSYLFSDAISAIVDTGTEMAKKEAKKDGDGELAAKLIDQVKNGMTADKLRSMGLVSLIS